MASTEPAHRARLPMLQEPMAEKRAQVEHLLEVLGLQVVPRPTSSSRFGGLLCSACGILASHRAGDMCTQGCADTHIGDVLSRGISGGQAKRTNIGIALISKCGSAIVRSRIVTRPLPRIVGLSTTACGRGRSPLSALVLSL